jgi:hypothetical protein
MTRYQDIPQFTKNATYAIDVSWNYLSVHYINSILDYKLDVNPEFQRGYIWTHQQKEKYIEFILKGGSSGRNIYFNCPGWHNGKIGQYILVDGKQRLDAVLSYLNNEFTVFGKYHNEYTDGFNLTQASFKWHVNDLTTYKEVLQWYIDLNDGGTIHTDIEINKVKQLIENNSIYIPPIHEIIIQQSFINDKDILKEAIYKREILNNKSIENYKKSLTNNKKTKKR